jgi:hypothetical protein
MLDLVTNWRNPRRLIFFTCSSDLSSLTGQNLAYLLTKYRKSTLKELTLARIQGVKLIIKTTTNWWRNIVTWKYFTVLSVQVSNKVSYILLLLMFLLTTNDTLTHLGIRCQLRFSKYHPHPATSHYNTSKICLFSTRRRITRYHPQRDISPFKTRNYCFSSPRSRNSRHHPHPVISPYKTSKSCLSARNPDQHLTWHVCKMTLV